MTDQNKTRPVVGTDVMGNVRDNLLDQYIAAWIEDNIEDAIMLVLAKRGGVDLAWDFQDRLTNMWKEVNGYNKEPQDSDAFEYPGGPIYVFRGDNSGYVKGYLNSGGRWIMAEDEKND
jgi:hypothetical protein